MSSEPGRRLRFFMNWGALEDLPQASRRLQAISEAGYDGVQFTSPPTMAQLDEAMALGLAVCGSGRVNLPGEAEPMAREAKAAGLECLTLHVGWGMEDDEEAEALLGAILDAQARHGIPLYPETHRATILQDPWRTIGFLGRFPQLELNGDFSHWYTGTEMVYGGFENKLRFMAPALDRIGFIHGRVGNPGSMQVEIGDGSVEGRPYVAHFRAMWTAAFSGFLRRRPQDAICFTPELLPPSIYYARVFNGHEESDRWQQSAVLVRIARECFAEAENQQLT